MAQTTIQGSFLGDGTVTGAKVAADFISAQTALASGLATTDEIIVSDAGVIKRMDISVLEIAATQITASGTLPALNGAALTALTAANITASGTLPALNGAALTALTAANITASGTLPVLNGSALTNLDADDLATGTVPVARLGDGNESNSTFLRGDNTWVAVTGTTINTNADNRVITGSGTANTLNGESNLTFTGSTLTIAGNSSGYYLVGGSVRCPDSTILDIYAGTTHQIRMNTGDTPDSVTIQVADLKVAAGNLVIGTAGKGIDFSAATPNEGGAGSASNSILDNYEEGTWVPELWDDDSTDTASYHNRQAVYTLIGNHVFLNMSWNWSNKTGLTANHQFRIGGLPFTSSNYTASIRFAGSIGYIVAMSLGGAFMPVARIDNNAAVITMNMIAGGGGMSEMQISHLGSDAVCDVTIDYIIA